MIAIWEVGRIITARTIDMLCHFFYKFLLFLRQRDQVQAGVELCDGFGRQTPAASGSKTFVLAAIILHHWTIGQNDVLVYQPNSPEKVQEIISILRVNHYWMIAAILQDLDLFC
jgi:hypothetical protein